MNEPFKRTDRAGSPRRDAEVRTVSQMYRKRRRHSLASYPTLGDSDSLVERWVAQLQCALRVPAVLAGRLARRLACIISGNQCVGFDILSLAELMAHPGCTGGVAPRLEPPAAGSYSGTDARVLLCGWLRPFCAPSAPWCATDVGVLSLQDYDGASSVACSACDGAVPPPELLGAFVLASAWILVPAAAGVVEVGHLELTGELVLVSHGTPLPPLPPRSFTVDEARRCVSRLERAGDVRLLHVRGELITLSEAYVQVCGEPLFLAEIASPTAGGPSCAIAFVGAHAARWRGVMQVGGHYVLTNLRQGRLERCGTEMRRLLRTSRDDCAHPERVTSVMRDRSGSVAAVRSQVCAQYILNLESLAAESQQQWDASQPTEAHSQCDDLINYEGKVTRWLAPMLLELDDTYLVFLSHVPTRTWLGMRVGAIVCVSNAHLLHSAASDDGRPRLRGFGICARGHLRVVRHATLASANVGPHHHSVREARDPQIVKLLGKLARRLTLAEMVAVYDSVVAPVGVCSWWFRWLGVLGAAETVHVLMHSVARTTESRCVHGEFVAHAAECCMLHRREPLLIAPPLSQGIGTLHKLPEVQAAMRNAQSTRRPQLLLAAALKARGVLLPTLLGLIDFEDALTTSQAASARQVVLVDATASVPLLLPQAERGALPRGVWALSQYHLLIEPSVQSTAALLIWARLLTSEPPFAPLNKPLFDLARPLAPPLPESPTAFAPGANTISAVLAIQRKDRRWTRLLDIQCVLKRRELLDEEKQRLHLCDADRAVVLPVYVPVSRLPPGMLPGCGLVISDVRLRSSQQTGLLYGELSTTSVIQVFRIAAHDFGATADVRLMQVAAATCAPEHAHAKLADIAPNGPTPLPVLRLVLTVRAIYSITLWIVCSSCSEERLGDRCRCPSTVAGRRNDDTEMAAELDADVTDGTGRATLRCNGRLVWQLLQASNNAIKAVQRAVSASGPLRCQRASPHECLSSGCGQWSCGASLCDANRQALAALWLPSALWQRQFAVGCMLGSRASEPSCKREPIQLAGGEKVVMLRPPKYTQLIACELQPVMPRTEAERVRRTLVQEDLKAAPSAVPALPLLPVDFVQTANPERAEAALDEMRAMAASQAERVAKARDAGVDSMPSPPVARPGERPAKLYWGLDPLFDAHVELMSRQLTALRDATHNGDVVWLGNHAVRHVSMCGVVVSVHPKQPVLGHERCTTFQLDDTTGRVDCVRWWSDVPLDRQRKEMALITLGTTMRVQGGLSRFREQRQLTAKSVWPERDPHAECLHWIRARELWHSCYTRAYRIPAWAFDDVGTCKPCAAASSELCMAVRNVLAHANAPLTARSIAAKLPAAAMPPISSSEAVCDALRQLEEESIVYEIGRNGAAGVLWRALEVDGAQQQQ